VPVGVKALRLGAAVFVLVTPGLGVLVIGVITSGVEISSDVLMPGGTWAIAVGSGVCVGIGIGVLVGASVAVGVGVAVRAAREKASFIGWVLKVSPPASRWIRKASMSISYVAPATHLPFGGAIVSILLLGK
jgi:hypothetical protein